jgi:hypothetical protein
VAVWANRQAKEKGRWPVAGPGRRRRPKRGGGGSGLAEGQDPGSWAKNGDGPKLKKKFLSNFKLNFGIWLDLENLHKEI